MTATYHKHILNFKQPSGTSRGVLKTKETWFIILEENKKNRVDTVINFDEIIDYLDIYSDEVRLNQIMLNLISNAVKFTNNGYIKVSCKFSYEKNDIIISVEDTGSGIKDEDKDLVFNDNNGRRIDLQYQQNKMGSGYGLKISYSISKKLNHILK